MKMKTYLVGLAAVLLTVASLPARAQGPQTPGQLEPGVARVSMIHGDVSTQRGDSGDWVAATLNTPIVTGDRVSTGQRSRAEVQLDYANLLRLSDNATAKMATLSRTQIQVQVGQGLAHYSVLKGSEVDVEIDTPNVAVHPLGEGSYRIEVNSAGETRVIVRKGEAEVSTSQGSTRVEKGQLITIQGTDNPQYQTASAPGKDDWDHWNDDRDHRISNAESWRHTSRYYEGTEDLDAYGHWVRVPDYDYVWVPAAGPGWVPYRDGRWVWEPYYGWTWVSYEPWGWAPYHYGRWFVYGGSWCWWPGPVVVYPAYRPIWAPAYVSFFGFGGRGHFSFGFGFGFGSIGWLPIGPSDFCHPWWGRGGNRVNVVNVTNITNINNINIHNGGIPPLAGAGRRQFSNVNLALTNVRVRQAVTSMPANQFGQGRVPTHQQAIGAASFRQGGVMTGAVPVTPTRESLRPTDRQANPSTTRTNASQRFFTKSQPSPAPTPFHEQAAQVQRTLEASRTNASANTQTMRSTGAASTPQSGGAARAQATTGPNKPGNPGTPSPQSTPAARSGAPSGQQTTERPGWHRFGGSNPGNVTKGQGAASQQSTPSGTSRTPQPPANNNRGNGSGPRPFTPPASNNRGAQTIQPRAGNSSGPRPFTSPAPRSNQSTPAGNQSGWQHFTPQPHQAQPQSGSRNSGGPSAWSPSSRGNSQGYSRPPLNLRQPIVTPRANTPYGYSGPRGGPGGGAPSGVSNGGPRGGYSGGSSGPRGNGSSGPTGGHGSTGGSSSHSSGGSGHSQSGRSR